MVLFLCETFYCTAIQQIISHYSVHKSVENPMHTNDDLIDWCIYVLLYFLWFGLVLTNFTYFLQGHLYVVILYMCSAHERRCYIVTLSLIGWAHIQNDPWFYGIYSLQWQHHGTTNHWQLHCLFNSLFKGNIKARHYWPFIRGIHLWPVDSLMIPLTKGK